MRNYSKISTIKVKLNSTNKTIKKGVDSRDLRGADENSGTESDKFHRSGSDLVRFLEQNQTSFIDQGQT